MDFGFKYALNLFHLRFWRVLLTCCLIRFCSLPQEPWNRKFTFIYQARNWNIFLQFFFPVHMTYLSSQWYVLKGINITKDPFTVWPGVPVGSYLRQGQTTNMSKCCPSMQRLVMQQVGAEYVSNSPLVCSLCFPMCISDTALYCFW